MRVRCDGLDFVLFLQPKHGRFNSPQFPFADTFSFLSFLFWKSDIHKPRRPLLSTLSLFGVVSRAERDGLGPISFHLSSFVFRLLSDRGRVRFTVCLSGGMQVWRRNKQMSPPQPASIPCIPTLHTLPTYLVYLSILFVGGRHFNLSPLSPLPLLTLSALVRWMWESFVFTYLLACLLAWTTE